MSPVHLIFDIRSYFDANPDVKFPDSHAQAVMRRLGITYKKAVPMSISDSWWFWHCENVPDPLPKFLRPLGLDPEIHGYYGGKGISPNDKSPR